MKIYYNILTIFVLTLFFFTNTFALQQKIMFIDIDYIYNNSNIGKKINENIKKKTKEFNDKNKNYLDTINEKKNSLLKKKNIIDENEFNEQKKLIQDEIKKINNQISKNEKVLIELRNKTRLDFSNQLNKVLQQYATDNSIDMIIDKKSILIGKSELNSTNKILSILNKNSN